VADAEMHRVFNCGIGFVLEPWEAQALIARDPRNAECLFPYLVGEDVNSRPDQSPSRWVINFQNWPLERAERYPDLLQILRERVKPEREKAKQGADRDTWWRFARLRGEMKEAIADLSSVIVACLVTEHWVPGGRPERLCVRAQVGCILHKRLVQLCSVTV